MPPPPRQLDLFGAIAEAYADSPDGSLENRILYRHLAQRPELQLDIESRVPIGASGAMHSPTTRKIRWHQMTMKQLGIIERVEGERGLWRLSENARQKLHKASAGVRLVAFSTDLGVAVWACSRDVFPRLGEPISLCVTSPPYPLRQARAYGNPNEAQYVDFLCEALEPIVPELVPGGSIVINIGNDVHLARSPARSLYAERLLLALHDRLGLSLMDRIPWVNYSKPPGPTWWACVNRVQLSSAHELVYWLTNDSTRVRSDNRRVLQAHTEQHRKLIAAGGEARTAIYGDGAYRLRPGSFAGDTAGRLPRNVIERGHACADTRLYRKRAKELGLPIHGAMQPTDIPDFFVRFLTEPDDLVVDPFGGTVRTGLAAERLGRRWLVTDWILEYLRGAAELFRGCSGFGLHPALASANWSVS